MPQAFHDANACARWGKPAPGATVCRGERGKRFDGGWNTSHRLSQLPQSKMRAQAGVNHELACWSGQKSFAETFPLVAFRIFVRLFQFGWRSPLMARVIEETESPD